MERTEPQKLHSKGTLYITNDIIENILARLPVKSLLRFQAVAETWKATISDPLFARLHLKQSKNSGQQHILIQEDKLHQHLQERFKLVDLKNQKFRVKSQLDCPAKVGKPYILCSCDGLLLLQCHLNRYLWSDVYAIWNPFTTKLIMFGLHSFFNDPMFYGLYYDSLGEEYKVVMGNTHHYAIFDCRNKSWIERKKTAVVENCWVYPEGVYFNGFLYWVALTKYLTNDNVFPNYEIVRFDPRGDDKFKRVRKSEGMESAFPPRLVLVGGHLCLYFDSKFQVLIMKRDDDQDSWTMFITINILPSMKYHLLFMRDENEIIMEVNSREYCLAYNPSKKTFVKIKKKALHIELVLFPFVESLALGTLRRPKAFEELREVSFLM